MVMEVVVMVVVVVVMVVVVVVMVVVMMVVMMVVVVVHVCGNILISSLKLITPPPPPIFLDCEISQDTVMMKIKLKRYKGIKKKGRKEKPTCKARETKGQNKEEKHKEKMRTRNFVPIKTLLRR